ncbi:MAG TPA: biotin transporter BioY [Melioribacteraceae bacterium]|nr:biotin transporter BioY [Melioribacteraceae bacterium]
MSVKENVKSNTVIVSLSKIKSSQLFWILTFSVLTFLSAQVAVPVQPVPFTLQTMLVLLSGAFLGARNGMISQIIYLAGGVIGLPIFAEFSFGFARLIGPTGGYLIAFPLAAFLVGYMLEKKSNTGMIVLSMVIGSLAILLSGSLYLSLFLNGDLNSALFSGAIIFSPWDVIKIAAAVSIYKAFSKKYPKLP